LGISDQNPDTPAGHVAAPDAVSPSRGERVEAAPGSAGTDDVPRDRIPVTVLLQQMRDGDRSAAADFVTRYGSRIRRRIRQKLSPAMRRIFDSQDILSTLGRRLDMFVRSRNVEAKSEAQLWALVYRIAENAVVDKARVFRRLQEVETEDGAFAHDLLLRLHTAEQRAIDGAEIEINAVMESIEDPIDRQILHLWLLGHRHLVIAEYVELAPTAVRKRWQEIRHKLHDQLAPDIGRR